MNLQKQSCFDWQIYLLRLWRLLQTHSPSPHLGLLQKVAILHNLLDKSVPKVTGYSNWFLEQKLRAVASQAVTQGDFCWVSLVVFLPPWTPQLSFILSWELHLHEIGFLKIIFSVYSNHLSLLIIATLLVYVKNSSYIFESLLTKLSCIWSIKEALWHLKH